MICPLTKLNSLPDKPCDEQDCGWWDKKKNQCGVLSYMQAYFAMGLATLKLSEATERMENNLKDD